MHQQRTLPPTRLPSRTNERHAPDQFEPLGKGTPQRLRAGENVVRGAPRPFLLRPEEVDLLLRSMQYERWFDILVNGPILVLHPDPLTLSMVPVFDPVVNPTGVIADKKQPGRDPHDEKPGPDIQ